MKPFNFRPIVLMAIGFVLGLVISFYVVFYKAYFLLVLLPICIIGTIIFIYFKAYVHLKKATIFIVAIFIACLSFFVSVRYFRNVKITDGEYLLSGRVDEVRVVSSGEDDKYYSLVISNLTIDDKSVRHKANLYLTYSNDIEIGDKIIAYCTVTANSDFFEKEVAIYNYVNGIRYYVTINSNSFVLEKGNMTIFERVNHAIKLELKKGLDGDTFSVAYALMTGKTEYMNGEVLEDFRYGGVAHIFAVSGLHISFIATLLSFILKKVRYEKTKSVFIICVLMFYTGVCGFPVSAIRATLMYAILLTSRVIGVKYDRLSSISLSMIIILLFSPFQLFTASFQLSYAVVIGLAIFSQPIKRKLDRFMPEKIAESFAFIISAQLGALPFILYYYGYFSVFSIIYNLFLVPIISIVFVLLFICIIISAIGLTQVFIPIEFVLRCIINVFYITSPEKFLLFFEAFAFSIFFYCLLGFAFSDVINFNHRIKKSVCYLLSVIVVTSTFFGIKISENKVRMTVIGGLTSKAVLFEGKEVALFMSGEDYYNAYKLKSLLLRRGVRELDCLFIDSDSLVLENVNRLSDVVKIKKVVYLEGNKFDKEDDLFVGVGKEEAYNIGIYDFSYWGNGNIIKFGKYSVLIDDEEFTEKVPFNIDLCICDQDFTLYKSSYGEVISFVNNDEGYIDSESENYVYIFNKIKKPRKNGAK